MFPRHYSVVEFVIVVLVAVSAAAPAAAPAVVTAFEPYVAVAVGSDTVDVGAALGTVAVVAGPLLGVRLAFVVALGIHYQLVETQTTVVVGEEQVVVEDEEEAL